MVLRHLHTYPTLQGTCWLGPVNHPACQVGKSANNFGELSTSLGLHQTDACTLWQQTREQKRQAVGRLATPAQTRHKTQVWGRHTRDGLQVGELQCAIAVGDLGAAGVRGGGAEAMV